MTNKVMLIGNIGKEPEISKTKAGMTIAKFSLATTKKVKGETHTHWHNLVSFGKLAEVIEQYTHKGDKLYVCGEIQYDSWDKQDGTKGYMTNIVVNGIELLSNKGAKTKQDNDWETAHSELDDKIPFN